MREKNSCNIDNNFKHIRILDFKTFQLLDQFFRQPYSRSQKNFEMKIADVSYGKEASACIIYVE
ncbi:hypothetical protein CN424_24565 [Bacillus cereus]|nr:hypothetical protein CN424_24565 [Bacillus cereus]